MVDARLVQSIDANDNGYSLTKTYIEGADPYLFDDFVYSFYPTWQESSASLDTTFLDLVEIARALLKREIKIAKAKEEAMIKVNSVYAETKDKRLIILDRFWPWKDVLIQYPEPLFVVYPVPDAPAWHVRAVPAGSGRVFKNRKDFPRAWAGKREGELAKVSGISDAIFCHNKLFLSVARSKEGAIALAKKALEA